MEATYTLHYHKSSYRITQCALRVVLCLLTTVVLVFWWGRASRVLALLTVAGPTRQAVPRPRPAEARRCASRAVVALHSFGLPGAVPGTEARSRPRAACSRGHRHAQDPFYVWLMAWQYEPLWIISGLTVYLGKSAMLVFWLGAAS